MSDTEGTTPALDLDAIRAEVDEGRRHREEHFACCSAHRLSRHVEPLLSAVASLTQERDTLRAKLTEAEAVIVNAQDALTPDHDVFWVLDDYDGSMDSVRTLTSERDEARDLAARRANAYLDAVHERNAAREQAEQAQARVAELEQLLACPECAAQGDAPCVVKGSTVVRWPHRARLMPPTGATSAPLPVCGRGCTTVCATPGTCPLDAPQPKDAGPTPRGSFIRAGAVGSWYIACGYCKYQAITHSQERADQVKASHDEICPLVRPEPAAAVPSSGVLRSGPCVTGNCAFCARTDCGCSCHEPEAFGGQGTAADEPAHGDVADCATCGQPIHYLASPIDAWWAHDVHPADGHDAKPATAGGTASSEPRCRCEYEEGDGIDCPVHPDPEPVEASSEQHGWTFHGYACCGKAEIGERPEMRARCMGYPGCAKCKADVDAIHAGFPIAPAPSAAGVTTDGEVRP